MSIAIIANKNYLPDSMEVIGSIYVTEYVSQLSYVIPRTSERSYYLAPDVGVTMEDAMGLTFSDGVIVGVAITIKSSVPFQTSLVSLRKSGYYDWYMNNPTYDSSSSILTVGLAGRNPYFSPNRNWILMSNKVVEV